MGNTLITGATDGIGLALARYYAQQGERLILIGRRERATLDGAFFTAERYCQADLARADCAQIIADCLEAQGINTLDRLIHNAGIGYFGAIADQTPEQIETVLAVNLRAPVLLTHRLLPHVRDASGQIVLISSVVASLPAPEYAVYAASKAALDEFGDNLRIELQGTGVAVQVIHPGATRTAMHSKIGIPPERMDTRRFPTPERVAEQIAEAIASRTPQRTLGIGNRLMRIAGKHIAGLIDFVMKRRAS
ncbi:MAG: SDR family NAD(P)-dependent oxidoreductase [Anaerolineae bacterium]